MDAVSLGGPWPGGTAFVMCPHMDSDYDLEVAFLVMRIHAWIDSTGTEREGRARQFPPPSRPR